MSVMYGNAKISPMSSPGSKNESIILNFLNGFAINESSEEDKKRYRALAGTHAGFATIILLYSIAFVVLDQMKCPIVEKHSIWFLLLPLILNLVTALVGIISMLTCHKYSIIHPIFACIHCILTVFTLMETIKLIIYVVGVTQDWFLGYIAKDYMHMSTNSTINAVLDVYWNTVLGWMSVVLLYLLIFNVFICFIISYLLGKYGVVFFILAYVLGKFVPL